ncbi:hypothetical protein IGI04_032968 [Brassica rapa subsp. trilocularis]|uniref:Uncharacterized protein n=1 Tax=Brassica rapa subsp. trilocularis TaxID=1813537 RepID=A0ABQ7L4K1_BRACM|nr:hypothetical protein IGI04_032968 [Brassica rapa subsp. trilocularis]
MKSTTKSQLTTGISPVAVYFNDISPRPDESQLWFQNKVGQVVRSGNHSKDPQYHSLDHFFDSKPLNVDPKNIYDSLQRLHLDPTWVIGSMRLNSYIYMKFMVGFSANAKAANVYKKKAESPTKTWIRHVIVTGISFTDSFFVLFISYVARQTLFAELILKPSVEKGKAAKQAGGEASETSIIYVTELPNAHGFISGLQQAYDTMVGERGLQLSGRK